ncbi:hypothetical protein O7634_00550 [Micromonospora sp. WMMD1120]|uniref:hypothetical protein n=1 Tax=Micromonospora sp. WMMD1120 TaxID=3016106 RepID=UPI0024174CA4|nr:hypothetical protein [Micromonospora sp. WMMD1120]MDG4805246.1 hypothetical protein [Micromonospora sp. WMMD1120]
MVSDPHAALRGLLTGRMRGHERRLRRFAEADWRRYADLLAGALLVAVRRRFVAGQDRGPVIRFVASVRGTLRRDRARRGPGARRGAGLGGAR